MGDEKGQRQIHLGGGSGPEEGRDFTVTASPPHIPILKHPLLFTSMFVTGIKGSDSAEPKTARIKPQLCTWAV